MGTLLSPVPEIPHLKFKPFPTRAVALRVARADHLLVGVGKTGTLYCTGEAGRKAAFVPGTWPWISELLTALVRLGVLSKGQRVAYLKPVTSGVRQVGRGSHTGISKETPSQDKNAHSCADQ